MALTHLDGHIEKAKEHFFSPAHAVDIVKKLLHHSGMIIDNATPIAQGHLPNNTRITVLKSPIVDDDRGIAASIRMLHPQRVDRVSLIRTEAITEEMFYKPTWYVPKSLYALFKHYCTKFTLDRHEGLSEITLSRRIDEEWREFSDIKMDYVSSKGTIYHVSVEEVSCQMVLLFEEGQYLRCIKPYVKNLVYTTDQDDKRILVDKEYSFSSKVLKHFNSASDNYFEATLYLPEQIMETALDVLIETDLDITCLCRELFDT